ncbi:MAG TPA: universal stress protein [Polyangiaceae bacterium]|nr:universal stress protein [Polyangiaceae bacterium]
MPTTQKPYVIVVAVDYSGAGHLAFDRALELAADRRTAEVHVINVLPVYQSGFAESTSGTWIGALPSVKEAGEQLRTYVEARLAAFRAAHPEAKLGPENIRAHQRLEVPSEEIAQLAADVEADLVVVGTHGRRGLTRMMLGSVAEATVRLAPCPVLVVRPKALPASVPAIQPPCPLCIEARRASGGKEYWCEQHSQHHGQRHTYHQSDRVGADTNMPLVMR